MTKIDKKNATTVTASTLEYEEWKRPRWSLLFGRTRRIEMIERAVFRSGMVLGSHDLYVGRGRGRVSLHSGLRAGEWGWLGNPFDAEIFGLDECIEMYAKAFVSKVQADLEFATAIRDLKVERVLCWCRLDHNCHGDFVIAYLEEQR